MTKQKNYMIPRTTKEEKEITRTTCRKGRNLQTELYDGKKKSQEHQAEEKKIKYTRYIE